MCSPSQALLALLALAGLEGHAWADGAKTDLILVSIGVSKFEFALYEKGVQFAAKDARDVFQLFKAQQGKLFGEVRCKLLTDTEATRVNIEKALAWAKLHATPRSLVIVFLAGHGGPDPLGEYEFLPHDADPFLPSTKVTGKKIRSLLQDIPGRRLLLLDTCHAGGFNGKDAGFITLASCTAQEQSSELLAARNGYFTSVLLEGLSGKADKNGDGTITLTEVTGYLRTKLTPLTGGLQTPTLQQPAHLAAALPLVEVLPILPATTTALNNRQEFRR